MVPVDVASPTQKSSSNPVPFAHPVCIRKGWVEKLNEITGGVATLPTGPGWVDLENMVEKREDGVCFWLSGCCRHRGLPESSHG